MSFRFTFDPSSTRKKQDELVIKNLAWLAKSRGSALYLLGLGAETVQGLPAAFLQLMADG